MSNVISPYKDVLWVDTNGELHSLPDDLKVTSVEYTDSWDEKDECVFDIEDPKAIGLDCPLFTDSGVNWVVIAGSNESHRFVMNGLSTIPSVSFGEFPKYSITLYDKSAMRLEKETVGYKIWQDRTDSDIVKEIAKKKNIHLNLVITSVFDKPEKDRVQDCSDYKFLEKLASYQNPPFFFKVTDGTIWWVDPTSYLKAEHLLEWRTGRSNCKEISFTVKAIETNDEIYSTFLNPKTNVVETVLVTESKYSFYSDGNISLSEIVEPLVKKNEQDIFYRLTDEKQGTISRWFLAEQKKVEPVLMMKVNGGEAIPVTYKTENVNQKGIKKQPIHTTKTAGKDTQRKFTMLDDVSIKIKGKMTDGDISILAGSRFFVDGCGKFKSQYKLQFTEVVQRVEESSGFTTTFEAKVFSIEDKTNKELSELRSNVQYWKEEMKRELAKKLLVKVVDKFIIDPISKGWNNFKIEAKTIVEVLKKD